MEVFVTNISFAANRIQIISAIAMVVHHHSDFESFNVDSRLNFDVHLHHPKKHRARVALYRTGTVTFPLEDIGRRFLELCGGRNPRLRIITGRQPMTFQISRNSPRQRVVDSIRKLPFQDPLELQEQEERRRYLNATVVHLSEVQFGWECRDGVFSVEHAIKANCRMHFGQERREFEISLGDGFENCENIVVSFSQVERITATLDTFEASVLFSLQHAPKFEFGPILPILEQRSRFQRSDYQQARQRKCSLEGDNHHRLAPYASLALRLLCSPSDYRIFADLWHDSETHLPVSQIDYQVESRDIFSSAALQELHSWMEQLTWPLAFHIDALVRNLTMDPKEVLDIKPDITKLMAEEDESFCAGLLHFFGEQLRMLWFSDDSQSQESVKDCFLRCREDYKHTLLPEAEDLFRCLHVYATPTSLHLHGPFPEQTNRVIRRYPDHKDHFVRVAFVDEGHLRFRFDGHIDGRAFIHSHMGQILRNGLSIAGRRLEFLHYSQSALKDHAVWFIYPFYDETSRRRIDAGTILDELGTFNNLSFDRRLVYCPARYAARISQAFTTTDSSITVDPGEIIIENDIKSQSGSCFTDGVGTVSPKLANEMWKILRSKKRRGFRSADHPSPRAFQIRFRGSKGMISVDHTLSGRVLVLRPSMIKFEAAEREVEIAGVFNKPGKMFLNRPLIMILEGLGVPADVFLKLQREAVRNVMQSTSSLEATSTMLGNYGLGQSFRLTSCLRNLSKLEAKGIPIDSFYAKVIRNAHFHILRDLKHKARIFVPGWTLVGVADVHSYLNEGEVFVCIEEKRGVRKYLQGPVSISRSPTIHPGDVQLARAIGPPPPGSPFAEEALENTLVFSTKGERSLPSCLGGGDLDGDLYNVTDYRQLLPRRTSSPASYDPAKRKEMDHPSSRNDVIDFICDYIVADNVGIIATNWLLIADQSSEGIHDGDCMKLAELHSAAVDYAKSGNAVPMEGVPRPLPTIRPDWSESETGQTSPRNRIRYYESDRAIGKLYRDIDLSNASLVSLLDRSGATDMANMIRKLSSSEKDEKPIDEHDRLWRAVKSKVQEFTEDLDISDGQFACIDDIFRSYSQELRCICSANSLSNKRKSRLSEAEAVIGTITARTSQRKRRTRLIAKLREHTNQLVTDVKYEIAGDDDAPKLDRLRTAWASWQLSIRKIEQKEFGAPSFFWVALSSIFDAIKSIEEEEEEGN